MTRETSADGPVRRSDRRAVLGSIATALAGAVAGRAGGSGTPAQTPTHESGSIDRDAPPGDGPFAAAGVRRHELTVEGDAARHVETFESDALGDCYGRSSVRYDEGLIPTAVLPDPLREAESSIVFEYEDAGVFGRLESHADRERAVRSGAVGEEGLAGPSPARVPDYDGPLYQYKRDDDGGSLLEVTGPINVAFAGLTAYEAHHRLYEAGGWQTTLPAGDRYVVVEADGRPVARRQWEHTQRSTEWYTPAQFHLRHFTLPDRYEYASVGQVHHDPWDHDKWAGEDPWQFARSRRAVAATWRDRVGGAGTATRAVGNGSGYGGAASSEGRLLTVGPDRSAD